METTPKPAFTVSKSTVELYRIRPATGFAWADITIDANGHTGRISIASDYGSWQHYWGACGCDFKTFLGQINQHYAAGKFGAERWVDVDRSIKDFKQTVINYRRSEDITADDARKIWDEFEDVSHESAQAIASAVYHTNNLSSFLYEYVGEISFLYEPNPHFASFWKELWPVLLAEFAHEKASASASTPTREGESHE